MRMKMKIEDHNFNEKFKPFRLKLLNLFYIGLRNRQFDAYTATELFAFQRFSEKLKN